VWSPCPEQGFEFEANLILNSAMFNLVEALPVMLGSLSVSGQSKVVDEYFNLLFEGEASKKLPQLHKTSKRMKPSKIEANKNDELTAEVGGRSVLQNSYV
jgi:hypothetical protein